MEQPEIKEEPMRVLHVLGRTDLGGAESRTMDIYRNIDRSRVQFDFIKHTQDECFFDEEIRRLGGHVYEMPRFKLYNYFAYKHAFRRFFKEHKEITTVHGQMTSTASIYLRQAKKSGIKTAIAHARSAGVDRGLKGIITRWMRKGLWKTADVCLSCSNLAGEAVFGKKAMKQGRVMFVPDALETERYEYCPALRAEVRKEYNLEDKFVIGHTGRFHYAKNHEFLLKVFACVREKREDAVLFLAGDGELLEKTKQQAKELGIEKDVIFAGMQRDVNRLYQAFDILLFPSRFEGLPGTVVEAQIAGLPCLISDAISPQVKITQLVTFYSLSRAPGEWAEALPVQEQKRQGHGQEAAAAGYEIKQQAEKIMNSYCQESWENWKG